MVENKEGKPRVSKTAWVVMLSVFVAGIVMAFAQYKVTGVLASPDPTAPSIARDLVLDNATAGWLLSLFTLVGIFLAFPAVAIIKKWGIKVGGLAALAFAIVGGVVGLFAESAAAIIIARVIEGFGLGFIGVIAPSAIAMWFPIEKRGAPMGIWSSWQMWGICGSFFFGIPITNAFGDTFGYAWKNLWIVGLILLVVAIVIYAAFVKVPPEGENHADLNDEAAGKVSIFAACKYKNAWIMALAGFAFGISNSTVIAWISPFWQASGTADAIMANNMTGAMYLIECIGCIVFGFVLNAITKRRRFMVVDSLIWAVAFFLIFHVAGIPGAIIMLVAYSVIESAYCAAMWTLCPQAVPDPRAGASMVAMFTVAVDLGMMLGSPLGGWFIDMFTGDYGALAYMVCGAQLVATICYALVKMYNAKGEAQRI